MSTEEQYASAGYNNQALLAAIQNEQQTGTNSLETHLQVMDSYREGTIDPHVNQSKNDTDEIPQTDYNTMF